MNASVSATELLRCLSVADIRQRLAALNAEQQALRTLLRAALRAEQRKGDKATTVEAAKS